MSKAIAVPIGTMKVLLGENSAGFSPSMGVCIHSFVLDAVANDVQNILYTLT